MKKILVVFGGIVQTFEPEFWQELEFDLNVQLSFGCSRWEEYEPDLNCWIRERLVFDHVESQKLVGDYYRSIAEKVIRHTDGVRPFNMMLMWHKWREIALNGNLDRYDLIIKTRSDVSCKISQARGLSEFIRTRNDSLRLAIPAGGNHCGGINDIFACGNSESMIYYLSLLNRFDKYYDEMGEFHPERMLRYHLIDVGRRSISRFPLEIILRGDLYNPHDCAVYEDSLSLFPSSFERSVESYKHKVRYFMKYHPVKKLFEK